MNQKSVVTNVIALALIIVSIFTPESAQPYLLYTGLFALSGALTNWLAVYMLFDKVPGLYGSGVIPLRFQEFKSAILDMIMNNFFTRDHVEKYVTAPAATLSEEQLTSLAEKVDWDPAFDGLIDVVKNSSFGGLLGMVGGTEALEPMRDPFNKKIQKVFISLASSEKFSKVLASSVQSEATLDGLHAKLGRIVAERLEELTPQMVKDIVQKMIREHLGWLVVWGGVFGGAIGLVTTVVVQVL